MLGVPGAVPTDGILPDRVACLKIMADVGNAAASIIVSDSNNANTTGQPLLGGDIFQRDLNRNVICLKDYYLKGNALTFQVDIEAV